MPENEKKCREEAKMPHTVPYMYNNAFPGAGNMCPTGCMFCPYYNGRCTGGYPVYPYAMPFYGTSPSFGVPFPESQE